LLALTSKEEEEKAIKAQCVSIESNIIGEISKDNRVKQRKVLQKQLFDISI